MKFFFDNKADLATLTETTQNPYYPVENIQDYDIDKLWKCLGTQATESVKLALPVSSQITSVIIDGHDFDGTETNLLLEGSNNSDMSAPGVSEAITYAAGTMSKVFTGGTHPYWRFSFTKANAADIRSIGRIFLGTYISPRDCDSKGLRRGIKDQSKIFESDYGKRFASSLGMRKNWRLPFSNIAESVGGDDLWDFYSECGAHKPFWAKFSETSPLSDIEYVYMSSQSYQQTMEDMTSDDDIVWDTDLELIEAK